MNIIHFFYKVRTLTNKSGDKTIVVKVYDSLYGHDTNFLLEPSYLPSLSFILESKFEYKNYKIVFKEIK